MNGKQGNLFDTEPQPWTLDDQESWRAARVAFPETPYGPYDYSIPDHLVESVQIGVRLRVPLGRGNRPMMGYCLDILEPHHPNAESVNPKRLKPIQAVVDQKPIINTNLLSVAKWISDYYLSPVGQVIETVVPAGVRDGAGTRELTFLSLTDAGLEKLDDWKGSPKQKQVLETLRTPGDWTPKELAATVGCTLGPINALRKKGYVGAASKRVRNIQHQIPDEKQTSDLRLNAEQESSLRQITAQLERDAYQTFLMHGITGSGKTEVYIRAIQKVVEFGRQAIVLVPEISLTPQTRQRFRARFQRVAVLHSHLTSAQRAWHWQQIEEGRVDVIIGARSAVFAPTKRLGLIILDEEHDGSFKQDKAPRYHARDVSRFRAQMERVPLILGSATPSLESWQRCLSGKDQLLSMKKRILDLPLPDVSTIDLRVDFGGRFRRGPLSQKLRQEIRQAIQNGGQVILLLNRRGFATRIQCPKCGHVEYCPDCSIPLTHHQLGNKAVCHYCDHQIPEPTQCSECQSPAIYFSGIGTQKLEQEVIAAFPDFPVMRMDTDTMRRPGSHEKALSMFRTGEIKILLGTQMIAKGLDFPNVTLVGVVNADSTLHFPDFRSAERTFGLVTQVAGRSGRGQKGGRVLVQTFSPDAPPIMAATRHDYVGFATEELPTRQVLGYPPFGWMARVVVRSEVQVRAEEMSKHIAEQIELTRDQLGATVEILGPATAPVEKLRGKYRFHIQLQSPEAGILQSVLREAKKGIKEIDDVQWIIDIDPLDML